MQKALEDTCDVFIITGNYGSGKTEVSVNLTNALSRSQRGRVTIADLDLVNPYFRSREARREMEQLGARVIAPEGEMHSADLPIVLPEIRGAINRPDGVTILDVGGDNVGATVLASLKQELDRANFEMLFVLNRNRPFTDTVEGALTLMDEIEAAARQKITGLIGNTHMVDETTLEISREGARFCREVSEARGVPVRFVTAPLEELVKAGELGSGEVEVDGLIEAEGFEGYGVLPLQRIMLPPWLGGAPPGSMATHARDRFSSLTGRN